jgi:hypothetical protein
VRVSRGEAAKVRPTRARQTTRMLVADNPGCRRRLPQTQCPGTGPPSHSQAPLHRKRSGRLARRLALGQEDAERDADGAPEQQLGAARACGGRVSVVGRNQQGHDCRDDLQQIVTCPSRARVPRQVRHQRRRASSGTPRASDVRRASSLCNRAKQARKCHSPEPRRSVRQSGRVALGDLESVTRSRHFTSQRERERGRPRSLRRPLSCSKNPLTPNMFTMLTYFLAMARRRLMLKFGRRPTASRELLFPT